MTITPERLRVAAALLAFSQSIEGSRGAELRIVPTPAEEEGPSGGESDLQPLYEASLLPTARKREVPEASSRQGKKGGPCFLCNTGLGDCGGAVVNGYCFRHYAQALDRAFWRMGEAGGGREVGARTPEGTGHMPQSLGPRRSRPHQMD